MIISHRHRFIFVAVPKTGTHSVRHALRTHLGRDDLEQARLFVEKALPWPELARVGHGHLSFAEVRPFMGEEAFASYLKFAFVRNPFARFVSYCAFATSRDGAFERDPKAVMRHFLFDAPPHHHMVFRPQHTFLTGADGALQADMLGKVEVMQASYDAITARIGVATAPLERVNASRHGDWREYYDAELIGGVERHYGRDLELFGYTFDQEAEYVR